MKQECFICDKELSVIDEDFVQFKLWGYGWEKEIYICQECTDDILKYVDLVKWKVIKSVSRGEAEIEERLQGLINS